MDFFEEPIETDDIPGLIGWLFYVGSAIGVGCWIGWELSVFLLN